ncbi:unnamed protein product [Pedinophyceae sp. YPF-701]|nr:unnamed protein product [Pedinophyceae sp. YPF-701]
MARGKDPTRMKTTSTQSRSCGSSLSLLDLHLAGGGPLSTIVTTYLDDAGRVALAAASSACMARVMEAADGCTWKPPSIAVARSVAERLCAQGVDGATRSTVEWADGAGTRWTRAGGAVGDASAIVAVHGHWELDPRDFISADMRALARAALARESRWHQKAVKSLAHLSSETWLPECVGHVLRRLDVRGTDLPRIPSGLTSLEELDISQCDNLAGGHLWLPASSAARLKKINASRANVTSFPPDMACLEELHAPGIRGEEWLPESSAGSIRVLRMDKCNKLPRGLDALEELRVFKERDDSVPLWFGDTCVDASLCPGERHLDEAYFAPLAGDRLRVLALGDGSLLSMNDIDHVPARFEQLVELNLMDYKLHKSDAWLDARAAGSLRKLDLSGTNVRRVPCVPTLEHLDVSECKRLAEDFLDAASRANVRTLRAFSSNITRVPSGMYALTKLDVQLCDGLVEGFLDDISAEHIKELSYSGDLAWLPAGLASLERLHLCNCSGQVRAEVAAGVRVLTANMIAPASTRGMRALEELELQHCSLRDGAFHEHGNQWVSKESKSTLRKLTMVCCESGDGKLPGGMAALEELSLAGMRRPVQLPSTSVGKLRKVLLLGCTLRRLPDGMESLEELEVDGCDMPEEDEGLLPTSSGRKLQRLRIHRMRSTARLRLSLPPEMTELEHLDVSLCRNLHAEAFLPASSTSKLRSLRVRHSNLRRLPPNMRALREVDVEGCGVLDDEWLPRSSAAGVTTLRAPESNLQRVPGGCSSLETAYLQCCRRLYPREWVTKCSAARLRVVHLYASSAVSAPTWAAFRCFGLPEVPTTEP